MKTIRKILAQSLGTFLIFTLLCGVLYTGAITVVAQVFFPNQSNGSIIEIDGVKYGSDLLGQHYTGNEDLWGRVMNLDVGTYQDSNGNPLMYSSPSNLSPTSEEYKELVSKRIKKIKEAHPDKNDEAIPVDLVTCSGSGLDPHISPAAAEYQVSRIAKARNINEEIIRQIIHDCTTNKFLGIFGEERVNVLKVNLMLQNNQ